MSEFLIVGAVGVWRPEECEGVWDGNLKSTTSMSQAWGPGLAMPLLSDGRGVEGGAGGELWGAVARWVPPDPSKRQDFRVKFSSEGRVRPAGNPDEEWWNFE